MSELYAELFYQALRIRLVEEKIIELYPSDKIQSPVHLSIGQEAVAVGICHHLKTTDLLFGSYRSHAFYLAKGGDLGQMFAELYGKVTGCGRGKAGSMHLAAPEVGFMGSSAVVASTIPHAIGAALAARQLGKDQAIIAVFGDGATEEGVYHECLNFAALHQLPVILVCENNGFAVHSRLEARQSYNIIDQARLYGIPATVYAQGYDLLGVHAAFGQVFAAYQRSKTPQFLEIKTYRYKEHVGPGDDFDAGYRDRKELTAWQSHDPLITDQKLVAEYRDKIAQEIDAAVAFAENSPYPDESELLADVI